MHRAGDTNRGENENISNKYIRLINAVSPTEKTILIAKEQSIFTLVALMARSPDEYLLKNSTGRFISFIITAALTDTSVLTSMRDTNKSLTP